MLPGWRWNTGLGIHVGIRVDELLWHQLCLPAHTMTSAIAHSRVMLPFPSALQASCRWLRFEAHGGSPGGSGSAGFTQYCTKSASCRPLDAMKPDIQQQSGTASSGYDMGCVRLSITSISSTGSSAGTSAGNKPQQQAEFHLTSPVSLCSTQVVAMSLSGSQRPSNRICV